MSNSADDVMVAEIRARTVMAEIEMQGMIAANGKRISEGLALAYSEESFQYLRDDLGAFLDRCNIH